MSLSLKNQLKNLLKNQRMLSLLGTLSIGSLCDTCKVIDTLKIQLLDTIL